jgi:hypothetical protein
MVYATCGGVFLLLCANELLEPKTKHMASDTNISFFMGRTPWLINNQYPTRKNVNLNAHLCFLLHFLGESCLFHPLFLKASNGIQWFNYV